MADEKRARVHRVVEKHIREVLAGVPIGAIHDHVRLKDLGANSIDRADIVTYSMEDLALRFPLRELADVENVGMLVDALAARLPE